MTRPKVDLNQKDIVNDLRKLGFTVLLLNRVKNGCPDILIGKGEINFLVEIKTTKKDKLTEDEFKFFETWKGQKCVATTTEEVVEFFDFYKEAIGKYYLAQLKK